MLYRVPPGPGTMVMVTGVRCAITNTDMSNPRKYGKAPYSIAVIHGGPGAPGEMAPVARELSLTYGVLEPFQSKGTLKGQLEELKAILKDNGDLPITLIGYSWGAMLCFIFAAWNPSFVKKLILVSSGVFEDKYAANIMKTRLSRLSPEERTRIDHLTKELNDPAEKEKNTIFAQLGELIAKADSYDPLPHENEVIEYQYDIYQSVWRDAEEMRSNGELLKIGNETKCPVVAIHGEYDPHPAEGVETPLSRFVDNFRFILLEHCGHHPWYEKHAKEKFFAILRKELQF
jgi:pimeloyl-ACP methyl ester carboxylesterase